MRKSHDAYLRDDLIYEVVEWRVSLEWHYSITFRYLRMPAMTIRYNEIVLKDFPAIH